MTIKTRTKKIYYLASPYTHKSPEKKKWRAKKVTEAAIALLKNGIYTFAPIAYNAPWERKDLPGDWSFWEKFDKAFIERFDGIIVLQLAGWDTSIGVTAEIEYAKELGLPVFYLPPELVRKTFSVKKLKS